MPYESSNTNIPKSKAAVLVSRNIELISAMQVLADCKHHEFARAWADKLYGGLSQQSLKTLSLISNMELQGLELFEFVLQEGEFQDLDALLRVMLEYRDADFLYRLLGEQVSLERVDGVISGTLQLDEILPDIMDHAGNFTEVLQYMFRATAQFKSEIVSLLKEIDSMDFDAAYEASRRTTDAPAEQIKIKFINTDHKELVQEAIGKKWPIGEFENYIFIPSYFISPHHLIVNSNDTLMVVYDAREDKGYREEESNRIAAILNVITDKTRLEILRQIISQQTYGKILAASLNLTTATISHHIELLKKANLIKESKIKNTKFLAADIEAVDKMLEDLKNYLYNK